MITTTDTQSDVDKRNAETSRKEVEAFKTEKPEKYFCYIRAKETRYGASGEATTWTGDKLGDVQFGVTWRDNFGGQRVSLRVYAINGCTYSGTFFISAGDYARLKKVKTA